ncbi:DNA repair protein RecN [Pseudolabrys taiwanensis]|uniref:DNA repair protein RecN n=1 Tax=Pseudolabrys taiwanensis TaxID=331696 RepID=A0A346A318_9HYPH|nr:DNA repair protein RecN [Pseudolabrys taiwanensis]AXK83565.1 DNA repair protein RecN [Pseudolabrys taiwanensis]
MLSRLSIRDIVLIDKLDIDFAGGLAVLTGETGAGKSILLDSFALALGGRGDQALVRQGQEQGQVIAVFELARDHPARALLKANDIADEDGLILRRVQFADGRTRAFVNDQPASVQVLKQLGQTLVEIHGQHDDRALVDAGTHRRLLDAFGALERDAAKVEALWEARRAAQDEADEHRAKVERAKQEGDWLRHAVDELTKLAPQAGEETALAERRTTMMQSEKVAEDLREAHDLLAGSNSALPALWGAIRRLERRAQQAPSLVEPSVKALDVALNALEDTRTQLEAALRAADYDPAELERIEERLFALRAGGRKYNVAVDNLAALAKQYQDDIALIDAGEDRLKELEETAIRTEAEYRKAAEALSKARAKAATSLDKAVSAELKPLKLDRAVFTTKVDTDPASAGPNGIDRVEFWVQTNPGTRPGPLMKVASGGELARFLLALKVVLADRGSAPTLVFDEIDTGVGGAVADAIGARMARLARGVQVLAVTHAPQVAARADRHYVISKDALEKGKRVATRVVEVAEDKRREEIARMLAGAEITNEARAAAERLLKAG